MFQQENNISLPQTFIICIKKYFILTCNMHNKTILLNLYWIEEDLKSKINYLDHKNFETYALLTSSMFKGPNALKPRASLSDVNSGWAE